MMSNYYATFISYFHIFITDEDESSALCACLSVVAGGAVGVGSGKAHVFK